MRASCARPPPTPPVPLSHLRSNSHLRSSGASHAVLCRPPYRLPVTPPIHTPCPTSHSHLPVPIHTRWWQAHTHRDHGAKPQSPFPLLLEHQEVGLLLESWCSNSALFHASTSHRVELINYLPTYIHNTHTHTHTDVRIFTSNRWSGCTSWRLSCSSSASFHTSTSHLVARMHYLPTYTHALPQTHRLIFPTYTYR